MEKPELTMPRNDAGTDELGISYRGPVLSGLLGLKQQLELQAASSPRTSAQIREIAPGGAAYLDPTTYSLPSNDTRLVRDPVYAAQREQLPHPSLADPVIRHHLNLPPLPDAYEERRRRAEHFQHLKDTGQIIVR